jgi:hypothetical protein
MLFEAEICADYVDTEPQNFSAILLCYENLRSKPGRESQR